eukprot:760578-Hanusia_phi.AAC.4
MSSSNREVQPDLSPTPLLPPSPSSPSSDAFRAQQGHPVSLCYLLIEGFLPGNVNHTVAIIGGCRIMAGLTRPPPPAPTQRQVLLGY